MNIRYAIIYSIALICFAQKLQSQNLSIGFQTEAIQNFLKENEVRDYDDWSVRIDENKMGEVTLKHSFGVDLEKNRTHYSIYLGFFKADLKMTAYKTTDWVSGSFPPAHYSRGKTHHINYHNKALYGSFDMQIGYDLTDNPDGFVILSGGFSINSPLRNNYISNSYVLTVVDNGYNPNAGSWDDGYTTESKVDELIQNRPAVIPFMQIKFGGKVYRSFSLAGLFTYRSSIPSSEFLALDFNSVHQKISVGLGLAYSFHKTSTPDKIPIKHDDDADHKKQK